MLFGDKGACMKELLPTIWTNPLKRAWFVAVICVLTALFTIRILDKQPNLPNYVLGKGVWIWIIRNTERGNVDKIVAKAVGHELDHVILNAPGGGISNGRTSFVRLMKALQAKGIKVLAWGYATGRSPEQEAERGIDALRLGADGYVINAEGEYRFQDEKAQVLCSNIRNYVDTHAPGKLIAYSTAVQIENNYWSAFPVEVFDTYCDVAMPQAYWRTINKDPDTTFNNMLVAWSARREAAGLPDKPIIPTGHAYRDGLRGRDIEYVPAREVSEFMNYAAICKGTNFWLWDLMGEEHWRAIKAAPGGLEEQSKKYSLLSYAAIISNLLKIWLFGVPAMGIALAVRVHKSQLNSPYVPYFMIAWPVVFSVGIITTMHRRRHAWA